MGMFDLFKDVSVETGGYRDLYMKYLEDCAMKGIKPMPFPDFVKMMQQKKVPTEGLLSPR